MQIALGGRTAIVTGSTFSSSNIGFGIAKRLAQAGASVLVNGRTPDRVDEAVEQLRGEVPQAEVTGVAADLTDTSEIDRLIGAVPQADVLVNNAGTPEVKPFFEITDEDWEHQIQLHLLAAVRLCRHYCRGMLEKGWGRILFNASTTGGFMSGEMAHYGATKAALLGLSRGLAENLAGTGVTVNCFVPGPTRERTEASLQDKVAQPSGKSVEEMEKEIFDSLPSSLIGRFIDPLEVGNLVVFLASEHASAITGAALRVDGGIVRFPL
jgi:NAD(P)-dependent dehydrogenase (short-subunit alcohol dehydrogenase family)